MLEFIVRVLLPLVNVPFPVPYTFLATFSLASEFLFSLTSLVLMCKIFLAFSIFIRLSWTWWMIIVVIILFYEKGK